MKRLEDFTREDLAKFRSEICLNSMFYSDFRNSFGIDEHSASLFFDSYIDFICELAAEDDFKWDYEKPGSKYYKEGNHTWEEFLEKYDTFLGLSMKTKKNGFVLPKLSESLKTL